MPSKTKNIALHYIKCQNGRKNYVVRDINENIALHRKCNIERKIEEIIKKTTISFSFTFSVYMRSISLGSIISNERLF